MKWNLGLYVRVKASNIRGTFLEVLIIRASVFGGLHWGHRIHGNYHIGFYGTESYRGVARGLSSGF